MYINIYNKGVLLAHQSWDGMNKLKMWDIWETSILKAEVQATRYGINIIEMNW